MAMRSLLILGLGALMIAFGFVSLSRGSITLAPILLVAGYCVAIPLGIMGGTRPREEKQSE